MKDGDQTFSSQLSAYLDDQLAPRERGRLEKALAEDPALRAELEGLEAARRLLRRLPREEAPADLAEAVLARLERQRLLRQSEQAPAARSLGWMRYVAMAAAVAIAVGLGVYLYGIMQHGGMVELARTRTDGSLAKDSTPPSGQLAKSAPRSMVHAAAQQRVTLIADQRIQLNTRDLDVTNRHVEAVLLSNGFRVVQDAQEQPQFAQVAVARQASPDSNRIVFYAEENQARAIVDQIQQIRGDLVEPPIVGEVGQMDLADKPGDATHISPPAKAEKPVAKGEPQAPPAAPLAGAEAAAERPRAEEPPGIQARHGRPPEHFRPRPLAEDEVGLDMGPAAASAPAPATTAPAAPPEAGEGQLAQVRKQALTPMETLPATSQAASRPILGHTLDQAPQAPAAGQAGRLQRVVVQVQRVPAPAQSAPAPLPTTTPTP